MAEWRTKEQIDADDELHRAIGKVLRVYSEDPEFHNKFMLTDYVVVAARVGMTEDTAQHTGYDYLLSNGSIPWHTMMGLMDWGYMAMKSKMAGKDEDDNS